MIRFLLCPCLLFAVNVFADDAVEPVRSWTHYSDRLLAEGLSRDQADARIAELLGGLRGMDRSAGSDRIGVQAPPFAFEAWLGTEPLTLDALKGRVVLVRWWTDTCPFCASSAPALRALHEQYGPEGLTVIGVFHPKARRDDPLDLPRVERVVRQRAFAFPIAVDWDWRNGTLRDWWLTGPDRPATSVTFILDKQGVIRHVHPGMEYHDADGSENHAMCVDDMSAIRRTIEHLLTD